VKPSSGTPGRPRNRWIDQIRSDTRDSKLYEINVHSLANNTNTNNNNNNDLLHEA